MEVTKITEENSPKLFLNLIKDKNSEDVHNYENLDIQCLKKYNERNEHFSIDKIISNENEEILAYHWIYQYENYQIKLEYFLLNGIWKIISNDEQQLNLLLEDLHKNRNLSLDQQIQIIIKRFDHHFFELKHQENNFQRNQDLISSILQNDDEEIQKFNSQFSTNKIISTSSPSNFLQSDDNLPLQSLTTDFQRKIINLTPIITSNRTRHDSSCSSTNSIKYTQFVPPSGRSIRQRRIIQSILLRVQRKKNIFEKVFDPMIHNLTEPTMYQLGLEFLRIYDGKFNYPQGYTFVMSFERKTWFLTIVNINCIQCQLGDNEPRSVLILKYKNKFTTVQV